MLGEWVTCWGGGWGRGLPLYYYCSLTTLACIFVHIYVDKLLSMPSVLRVAEWPFELGLNLKILTRSISLILGAVQVELED